VRVSRSSAARVLSGVDTALAVPLTHAPPHTIVSAGALVLAAGDGDARAVGELYTRHAPRVRAVLLRILQTQADVDDALQETFARGFAKLRSLRDPEAFASWIVSVAVNVARRQLRARRRRAWLTFAPSHELPELEAPVAAPDLRAAARAAEAVLRTFPVDERIAFSLRYLDGMTLDEVAMAAGVSLATIKRRLVRAENRLRAAAAQHPALARYAGGAR
jgi:RNA polymerase sigma-70 factor, ECF subfamily